MFQFFQRLFASRMFRNARASTTSRRSLPRIVLGVVGVALLLALVFFSVFIGLAMLAIGMVFRLLKQRGKPMAVRARSIDGDYRVVGKAQLPLAR